MAGRSLLVVPFVAMMASGSIASVMLPVLAGVITLAGALKTDRCPTFVSRVAAGLDYLLIGLALGFRQFPGLAPFPLLEIGDSSVPFPPEKLLLRTFAWKGLNPYRG